MYVLDIAYVGTETNLSFRFRNLDGGLKRKNPSLKISRQKDHMRLRTSESAEFFSTRCKSRLEVLRASVFS